MKGYKRYDKNTIRVPRQDINTKPQRPEIRAFEKNDRDFYNLFTTFEAEQP